MNFEQYYEKNRLIALTNLMFASEMAYKTNDGKIIEETIKDLLSKAYATAYEKGYEDGLDHAETWGMDLD